MRDRWLAPAAHCGGIEKEVASAKLATGSIATLRCLRGAELRYFLLFSRISCPSARSPSPLLTIAQQREGARRDFAKPTWCGANPALGCDARRYLRIGCSPGILCLIARRLGQIWKQIDLADCLRFPASSITLELALLGRAAGVLFFMTLMRILALFWPWICSQIRAREGFERVGSTNPVPSENTASNREYLSMNSSDLIRGTGAV